MPAGAPGPRGAAAHFGEEPCISGPQGSGTIFFTGCSLGCAYCQNAEISGPGGPGRELTVPELRGVMLRLRDKGVHNINIVTGTHYIRPIAEALDGLELGIPVVWNSSGYESVEALKRLEGLVQIYMPDFKYSESAAAARYSNAPDYPEAAAAAILEMFRQTGPYRLGDDDMLQSGVIIRHLILPGNVQKLHRRHRLGGRALPHGRRALLAHEPVYAHARDRRALPRARRPVDPGIAQMLYEYLLEKGIEDGYYQEPDSSGDEMIPAWDLTGL